MRQVYHDLPFSANDRRLFGGLDVGGHDEIVALVTGDLVIDRQGNLYTLAGFPAENLSDNVIIETATGKRYSAHYSEVTLYSYHDTGPAYDYTHPYALF